MLSKTPWRHPEHAEATLPLVLPLLLLPMLLLPPMAQAEKNLTSVQQGLLEQLNSAARQLLDQQLHEQGWQIEASSINAWLPGGTAHLPACRQTVQLTRSNPAAPAWGKQSYMLQCPDKPGWQTRGEVQVTLTLPVWVAAHAMDRGHALEAADLRPRVVDVSRLRRSFTPLNQSLIGFRTQRRVSEGEMLTQSRLGQPLAVHKGTPVTIYAREEGFSATAQGEAEADGSIGDVISVRNLASGKRIKAEVTAQNEVETRF